MKRLLVLALALLALSVSVTAPAQAVQDFNVGDRVEVDALGIGKWEPGVVIEENADAYLVRVDPARPGMLSAEYTIPKTGDWVNRIRPSTAPLPPDQKVDTRKPTGILDCPILQGINGQRIAVATLKKMVRCLLEYYEGDDYASRVDIKSFKVGKPRQWNPYSDIGPGTLKTPVYPIRVMATQLWWTAASVQEQRWLRIFDCYYSTLDEWMCGLSQRLKDWTSVTRPRG
ncbi:MAG: hypothetical protein ACR2KE_00035 [Candidatus Nanopelagicales bacterium]